jgi:hypothetical protein
MSIHLSSDQMSKFLIGEATAVEQQHARECIECMDEMTRLQTTLSALRHSVQNWTAENCPTLVPGQSFLAIRATRFNLRPRRWAVAIALIGLLAVPIYKNIHQPRRHAEDVEDTLLLEQVNAHLSRSIPTPMEPLMRLLSDVPAEQAGGQK